MFTFLVVGNLHPNSLQAIPIYQKFGSVIISCDYRDKIDLLHHYRFATHAHLIFNDTSSNVLSVHESTRANMHYLSDEAYVSLLPFIAGGISFVKTPFVIIVRSDEFYTEWSAFTKALLDHPYSLVMSSLGCQKLSSIPFLLSNHLIAGRTNMIANMFDNVSSVIYSHDDQALKQVLQHGRLDMQDFVDVAQLLCVSFLASNGLPSPLSRERQHIANIMNTWFHVVSVDLMGSVAYNLSTIKDPRMMTLDKIRSEPNYVGQLEYKNKTMEDILREDSQDPYKSVVSISRCVAGEDWYQVIELCSNVINIDNMRLLKDIAKAALHAENDEVANLVWNQIVKLNPQYK